MNWFRLGFIGEHAEPAPMKAPESPPDDPPEPPPAAPPEPLPPSASAPETAEPAKPDGAEGESKDDKPGAIDPAHPPSLKHTKLVTATLADAQYSDWNTLLGAAIKKAHEFGLDMSEISRLSTAIVRRGQQSDPGYVPISGTDLSLQEMSPDNAFHNAYVLAKAVGAELKVEFRWQDNPDAAHPGETGVIHFDPNPS